jgi:hypothetical protein
MAALPVVRAHGAKYEITWVCRPIPADVYKKLRNYFTTTGYGPATTAETRKISSLAAECGIHSAQVLSIRNITIKDRIIKGHARMNAIIDKLTAEYNAGADIVVLSRRYDFPPQGLLRGILLRRGIAPAVVYGLFTYRIKPETILPARDTEQFYSAELNDANSTFNQDMAAERAAAAENGFVKFLRDAGIPLRTQEDLAREQIADHGRAVNTPDVFFDANVVINGNPVKWIDYKDYVGTNVSFLYKSNREQAGRYHAAWGPGAMCYGGSFVEGLAIPGAIMLDGGAIKKNIAVDL